MTVSDDDISEMLDGERLARRTKVMFLRNGGVTWAKVAQEVGVSEKTARKDYELVCRDINNEDPAHVVARHRAQIYDVCRAMYPRLMGQNFDQARDAAVVILRAQERESRLLGLDSPTRVLATLSNEDFATEAARLITSIQQLDAATLKELSSASSDSQIIDVETDETGDEGGISGNHLDNRDVARSADEHVPNGQPEPNVAADEDGNRGDDGGADVVLLADQPADQSSGPDVLPDDDDDWSNL
jgi:hypothetical protein